MLAPSARRHAQHLPFRNRWHVVKYRSRITWGQWFEDVVYLLRG